MIKLLAASAAAFLTLAAPSRRLPALATRTASTKRHEAAYERAYERASAREEAAEEGYYSSEGRRSSGSSRRKRAARAEKAAAVFLRKPPRRAQARRSGAPYPEPHTAHQGRHREFLDFRRIQRQSNRRGRHLRPTRQSRRLQEIHCLGRRDPVGPLRVTPTSLPPEPRQSRPTAGIFLCPAAEPTKNSSMFRPGQRRRPAARMIAAELNANTWRRP